MVNIKYRKTTMTSSNESEICQFIFNFSMWREWRLIATKVKLARSRFYGKYKFKIFLKI